MPLHVPSGILCFGSTMAAADSHRLCGLMFPEHTPYADSIGADGEELPYVRTGRGI